MQQLLKYLRNPDEAKDAGEAIAEMGRWRRAQVSVTTSGMAPIPPFEYLDGLMRIVRPTAEENEELTFMISSIKNDPRYHTPDVNFVKECEQRMTAKLQLMGISKSEDKSMPWVNQQQSGGPSTSQQQAYIPPPPCTIERKTFELSQPTKPLLRNSGTQPTTSKPPATADEGSRQKPEPGVRQQNTYQVTFDNGRKANFKRDPATILCKQGPECPFLKKGTCCFMHPESARQEEGAQPQRDGTPFAWECGDRPDPPHEY